MNIRRPSRFLLALTVASTLALSACTDDSASDGGTIKIAAPMPLSGPAAAYGKAFLKSAQITVDKINAAGGVKSMDGAKLEIVSADDEGLPDKASALLREMIDDGATAAIGPIPSASVLASQVVLDELQVPMVSPSFDTALTDQGSQFFFRIIQPSEVLAEQGVAFLKDQMDSGAISLEKVGSVTMNVPPGTGAKAGLESAFDDIGVDVMSIDFSSGETKDFGPIISRLRDADVDLVTGHIGPGDAALFAKALELQDWRPKDGFLWIAGGPSVTAGIEAIGPVLKNWMVVNYAGTSSANPAAEKIAKAYRSETGDGLDAMSGSAPAVVGAIHAALEIAGEGDGPAIRDALRKLDYKSGENWDTLAGGVKFDEVGNNVAWEAVITQHDGKGEQATIYPADVAVAKPIWPAHD